MSGLGELGGLPQFIPGYGGQVAESDIDRYKQVIVTAPSVDGSFIGTISGTVTANTAIVKRNILLDWPRNVKYAVNGITNGTYGGTFTATFIDQFGQGTTENVVITSAINGGTTFGTAIVYKFIGGTFQSEAAAGTFIGTAAIGVGTAIGASGNWFGLMTKIGATGDVKLIRYNNNGAGTVMGGGSLQGTNVSVSRHAFQGTGGVLVTDTYSVLLKSTFDNTGRGTMAAL